MRTRTYILLFLFLFGLTSAQTNRQDTVKRKKTEVVKDDKSAKRMVKTRDQKKVIRKTTAVKPDTVLVKPANN